MGIQGTRERAECRHGAPGACVTVGGMQHHVDHASRVQLDASPGDQLVTCSGPFDPVSGHYRDNFVVVAAPIT